MHQHHYKVKSKLYYYIIVLFQCLILSCAQITAPTGGERDTKAPEIVSISPANKSTNFNNKSIQIVFNEWIQALNNPKSQVIISPNIEPFPVIDIARNDMKIKIKDTLQSNTTYSIFFGDNIKDNNEGNPLPNFTYIFSTGNFIDSLSLKGNINTKLDKFPDNTFLLLYKEMEDSVFTKKRPFYITKIKSDGYFSLENIKEGQYKIFALSDKNNNYYYDLPTEEIAFSDSMTTINANVDSLSLELFLAEEDKLRIIEFDRTLKNGICTVLFNKELSPNKDDITATVVDGSKIDAIAFQDKTAKKLQIYFPKLEKDTNNLIVVLKNNAILIDTLRVQSYQINAKQTINFFTDSTVVPLIETQALQLHAAYYSLSNIDTSKIQIRDSSNTSIPFSITRKDDLQTYIISALWKPGMRYKLSLQDSVIADLVGNFNKTQEFSFSPMSAKKAGNLLITYELPQNNVNYIVFLKNSAGKVLDKQIIRDSQRVQINYGLTLAGTYFIEVIEDANGNGIWNSGSFINKTLPEKIYKEAKPIIIKENWDAEETIKVDFSASKSVGIQNITSPQNTPAFNSPNKTNKGATNTKQ
ncbi:MAG TPA: Ig-like domain-containing protein [Chitinophagales bacterium]|nr:Ig-like domain-containing protein [Chitinophagales bacterium]